MNQANRLGARARLLTALSDRPNRANTEAICALADATTAYLDDGSLPSRSAREVLVDLASPDFPRRLAVSLGIRPGTIRDRCGELERRYGTRGHSHSRGRALVLLAAESSMGELFEGFLDSFDLAETSLANDLHAAGYVIGRWAREHTNLLHSIAGAIDRGIHTPPARVNAITRLFELVLERHELDGVGAEALSSCASESLCALAWQVNRGQPIAHAISREAVRMGMICDAAPGLLADLMDSGSTATEATLLNELLLTEVGYREPDDWAASLIRDLDLMVMPDAERRSL